MPECGVTWSLFYEAFELMEDACGPMTLGAEEFGELVCAGCREAARRLAAWPGEQRVTLRVVAWWQRSTVYEEQFACGTEMPQGDALAEARSGFTLLLRLLAARSQQNQATEGPLPAGS